MENAFLKQVGNRILTARIRRDLSRKRLADQADVQISAVIQMEKGTEAINIEDAVKICNALGFSAEYILTGNCGMAEFFRLQQHLLNLPDVNQNLHEIATIFWEELLKANK